MTILGKPDQTNDDPRKPAVDSRGLFWPEHPEGEWPGQPTPTDPARRCVRIKKDGNRCRRPAIPGGTVCRSHGGLAPQIAAAARARLEKMSNRMAEELLQIALDDAFDGDPRHRTVRLAAINSALDRAGIKPPEKIEVGAEKPFETMLGKALVRGIADISREESRKLREQQNGTPSGGQEPLDVEAEEIPDVEDDPSGAPPKEEAPYERIARMGKRNPGSGE